MSGGRHKEAEEVSVTLRGKDAVVIIDELVPYDPAAFSEAGYMTHDDSNEEFFLSTDGNVYARDLRTAWRHEFTVMVGKEVTIYD